MLNLFNCPYTSPDATQCFNHSPDAKLKLLKKLYCRLEEREATMGSVVMFGLTAEERDQVCSSLAVAITWVQCSDARNGDLACKNDCSSY